MAGLATHADFRKARGEAIVGRVIVFSYAGRVALGAHEIPVLVQLGPMQNIVVLDLLAQIEMEPTLSALVFRPAIPGDRERLQAAIREFDEILLQRIDAEGVFHLERGELAVGAVGLDEEFPALAEEAGMHAVIIKACVGEIAQHRCLGRVLHGEFVLRAVPGLRLRRMALRAGVAADECERRSGATEKTRPRRVTLGEQLPGSAASEDRDRRSSDNDYDPSTRTHYCISARRASNDAPCRVRLPATSGHPSFDDRKHDCARRIRLSIPPPRRSRRPRSSGHGLAFDSLYFPAARVRMAAINCVVV